MNVHTVTIVTNQWLRHERRGLAVSVCDIVDTIFVDLDFVRFADQCVELRANFALPCCTDFVVMQVNVDAHGFHSRAHAVSYIQK